jgi:hypothetical protein
MQIFGLLTLLVTIAGGVYLVWFSGDVLVNGEVNESRLETYDEAISEAKDAVKQVYGKEAQVEVYSGIKADSNSIVLDLSGRNLEGSLKAEVRMFTNLEELNLNSNEFTGLPAEIGQLSKLRVLNLANNPLTGLPYELGNLQKLEILDLRGTNYAKADLEIIKAKLPGTTKVLVD